MKITLKNLLVFVIVLITISSVQGRMTISIGNTIVWWVLNTIAIIVFVKTMIVQYPVYKNDFKLLWPIKILLYWYIICIIRGCIVADNYWEWKNLVGTSLTMLIPLVAYLALSVKFFSYLSSQWLLWCVPLFILFLPFMYQGDGPGRYLVPVSIFLMFLPYITTKWKLYLLILALPVFLGSLDYRSNIIKFTVPLLCSLGFYIRLYKSKKLVGIICFLLMCVPFFLMVLAVVGTFNIFKMEEYLGDGEETRIVEDGKEVNLTADTRTLLYVEVLQSALKYDYYLFGRTPARGNESDLFGWRLKEIVGGDSNERYGNEVSILNIFTWTGLLGVLLYFIAFARGAFLACLRSENQAAKVLGLYVLFRWCYAWVEDFTIFGLSYLYLWLIIGLCYSPAFRNMSDSEIKLWINGIFDKKYRKRLSSIYVSKSTGENGG